MTLPVSPHVLLMAGEENGFLHMGLEAREEKAAYRSEVWLRQKYASCALPGPVHTTAIADAFCTPACAPADEVPPAPRLQFW